ncbi:MAG: NfeD family protein [Rhodospirillales bacterium]|nr:NfeD family protein [Rhodospirillales bacterium]
MSHLHPALPWLVAGLLLLVAEILAPGVFLMWLGLAALGTGALVLLRDPGFAVQVVAFAVLAALSIAAGLRLRRRGPRPHVNTAESGLVGRTARALAFEGKEGRVRVGDSEWAARLASDAHPPKPGDILRVRGVDGTVLVVGP